MPSDAWEMSNSLRLETFLTSLFLRSGRFEACNRSLVLLEAIGSPRCQMTSWELFLCYETGFWVDLQLQEMHEVYSLLPSHDVFLKVTDIMNFCLLVSSSKCPASVSVNLERPASRWQCCSSGGFWYHSLLKHFASYLQNPSRTESQLNRNLTFLRF